MSDRPPIPGHVLMVVGTRPEAVKLAPLVLEARTRAGLHPIVVSTGQHRKTVHQMLDFFGVPIDVELSCDGHRGELARLTASLQAQLAQVIAEQRIDTVVVQGDTASAVAGALAGFYLQRPVHHVEAGLRSGDLASPFPEEANRRVISVLTTVHHAPTALARHALLREGVDDASILVTGNTGIDALLQARDLVAGTRPDHPALRGVWAQPGPLMVVTAHRRESWGAGLAGIAEGVRRIVDRHQDLRVVLPVHGNPMVRQAIVPALCGVPRVLLTEPLGYPDMVRALSAADLVLTDSGGIQEEAVTLGVPTLVTRDTTERAEGIEAGGLRLVGVEPDAILREAHRVLRSARAARSCGTMLFGDGHASRRIADRLETMSTRSTRLRPGSVQPEPSRLAVSTPRRLEGVSR